MKNFKNKVVVITGGATGIGFGLAKRFGKEGAIVRIAGLRENRLQEAVQTLQAKGVAASYQICDVTKESDLIELEKTTRSLYGSVDVLVNNAGIGGPRKSIFDITQAEIMETLNVNYFGVWHGIRVFGKQMRTAGTPCAIYTVGSENSFFNAVINAPYVSGKYAVLGLTKALRDEAPDFMDVGIIIPGFVHTEIGPDKFMKMGMSPEEFADIIVPQMKAGQFYLVGHSYNLVRITEEYEEVKATFDKYAPRYEGDEKYDVKILGKRLKAR
ncbi:MAG: SDR family NAD(P)-dependent oxidoreductase [Saprospiraceae bacterium]